MSGTTIPLAQFAQQLAAAGSGANIAGWTASIASGSGQRSLATAFADAPFIEWFGACGLGGDDTAVFSAAAASGIPFRLGPKTYIVNGSWSTGSASFFILRGYPGLSRLLRMSGGTAGGWVGLECALVDVDGVIFDCNGTAVQANTWGVLVDSPVMSVRFSRCAFRNNSGSLGRGLAIIGNPTATVSQTYVVEDCEFSGNTSDGCGVFQASSLTIVGCRAFDNGGSGIGAAVFGTPSATLINSRVLIQGNQCWGNGVDGINLGTLNPSNAAPPDYTLASPALTAVSVLDNLIWSNASYGIQVYGDYYDISGNQITQTTAAAGGIVITARYSRVSRNTLNVPGVYIGIDSGGCFDCDIADNSITGARIGINPGGSQFVTVSGNKLRGCAIGMSIYDIEADGNGDPFPAPVSCLTIERNTIVVGAGETGVSVLDGGSAIAILENRFQPSTSGVAATQAVALRSGGVTLRGNSWNGSERVDLNPSNTNILEVPDVIDTIRIPNGGEVVDSLLPASLATTAGQISYLTVTNGGAGYSHATVAFTGAGVQGQATVMVYAGSVIGFRVTNNGSGYAPGTTCTITGDGSGAAAIVVVGTPLQPNRELRLLVELGTTLKQTGTAMTQSNSTQRDLVLPANSAVSCIESNGTWVVADFYPSALLQSAADGDVTLAAPAGGNLRLEAGSGAALMAPGLPTAATGLASGAVWRNGNVLNIV